VVLTAACSESGDTVDDVRGSQPQGGSGPGGASTGGTAPESEGGAGGLGASPGANNGGEGGIQASAGASGSAPDMGAGGTGSGAGGEPTTTQGGAGGTGSVPPTGGTGGQPIITPPPIDPSPINCAPAQGEPPGLRLTPIASGLGELTHIVAAPGDDTRLLVLERIGRVQILENGVRLPQPFLDLTPRVDTINEEGLIGLAFHPRYSENGRLYVQYASVETGDDDAQRIILSEFTRSLTNPNQADPASERILMIVEQPSDIHLGGMLAFGLDGFLYISRGDGGSSDSQNLGSWLGKMLRIDVDTTSDDRPYGIPDGNMTGGDVLPEIWSRGWRNPWRFSFDACTGDMFVGDVGEARREEIDFEPRNTPGLDYGWTSLEGTLCLADGGTCDPGGLTPPVLEYEHSDFGCAVIGGYVYRGERIAGLRGTYLYADYCSGNFGSFRIENGQAVDRRDITLDINPGELNLVASFGVDNSGEIYLVTTFGTVYRIDPD
jgi:glucose/arabinose dehydrogenase